MKSGSPQKRKPEPSSYQIYLRKTTFRILLAFALVAVAVATAVYYWQRHSLKP